MICENDGCENTTQEGYRYCYNCYEKWKQNKPEPKPWHDDPVVDQLMKINNNLQRLTKAIEQRGA